MKHDVSKLTVWAQELIATQQRRINELEGLVGRLRKETGESDLSYSKFYGDDICIPSDSRVKFKFGDREFIEVSFDRVHEKSIMIYGSDCILVKPNASNTLSVLLTDAITFRKNK